MYAFTFQVIVTISSTELSNLICCGGIGSKEKIVQNRRIQKSREKRDPNNNFS